MSNTSAAPSALDTKPLLAAAINDTVQLWQEQDGKLKLSCVCETTEQPATTVNSVDFNHNSKCLLVLVSAH